jgi:hypothetical protein
MKSSAYPEVPYLQKDLIDFSTYGPYPNRTAFEVNGFVENVDNVRVDVTNIGGTTPQKYVFPPAGGIQMQVKSSSANDDGSPAGTGAQTVHIHYLDANHAIKSETVTLNGVAAVTTVATDILRVNAFHVTAVGSAGECAGNVTLTNVGATIVYARIDAGFNSARNAVFTIPAGKHGFISHWSAYSGSTGGTHYSRMTLRTTAHEDITYPGVFLVRDTIAAENGGSSVEEDIPFHCPEKTDIKISCVSDATAANAFVNAHFSGWYE